MPRETGPELKEMLADLNNGYTKVEVLQTGFYKVEHTGGTNIVPESCMGARPLLKGFLTLDLAKQKILPFTECLAIDNILSITYHATKKKKWVCPYCLKESDY